MSIGGLGARAAMLKNQKPTKKCERCGLRYVEPSPDKCPHCGDLCEARLHQLLDKVQREAKASKSLGKYFLFAAILTAVLLVLASVT